MTLTTIPAGDLTTGTNIHRDGQDWIVTAIGENAFDEILVDVECVTGNVGQTTTWKMSDPDESITVHAS